MTFLLILIWIIKMIVLSPGVADLEVTVQNIQSNSGQIMIALYDDPENFPNQEKAYKVAEVKAQMPDIRHTFRDIPAGDYAIAVFHDENDDGELNFKLFFIPKEPYGFSNNFIPRFSKPAFDDARFTVKGRTVMTISLVE